MPETLDHLIDRIRKEGVEKAEKEGAQQVAEAEKKAAEIVDEAEKKAAEIVERAKTKAQQLDERGRISLAQAARDTLLSVSKAIDNVFEELARRSLGETLDRDMLHSLITEVIKQYFSDPEKQRDIAVLLSGKDVKNIEKQLMAEFGEAVKKGLTIGSDEDLTGGFRVVFKDDHIFHDLSEETMAKMLCVFLRPQLAEITREALRRANPATPEVRGQKSETLKIC